MYRVTNFGTGEVFFTNNIRLAYKFADGWYRQGNTAVTLINLDTGKALFSRCDNDYAFDQWFKYMNDEPNVLLEITEVPTV